MRLMNDLLFSPMSVVGRLLKTKRGFVSVNWLENGIRVGEKEMCFDLRKHGRPIAVSDGPSDCLTVITSERFGIVDVDGEIRWSRPLVGDSDEISGVMVGPSGEPTLIIRPKKQLGRRGTALKALHTGVSAAIEIDCEVGCWHVDPDRDYILYFAEKDRVVQLKYHPSCMFEGPRHLPCCNLPKYTRITDVVCENSGAVWATLSGEEAALVKLELTRSNCRIVQSIPLAFTTPSSIVFVTPRELAVTYGCLNDGSCTEGSGSAQLVKLEKLSPSSTGTPPYRISGNFALSP